jgi:hypothetical protein
MREDSKPSTFRDAVAVLAMLAAVITIIIGLIYLLAQNSGRSKASNTFRASLLR